MLEGTRVSHRAFSDLPEYLRAGDVLVLNETRVIAARLFGTLPWPGAPDDGSGTRVEILLLHPSDRIRYDAGSSRWSALVKPGRKLPAGARVSFREPGDASEVLGTATVTRALGRGLRDLEFALSLPFERFLERAGRLPLPPYVRNDTERTRARYQTVFAREPGSVAAPTASLHFTTAMLDGLCAKGVEIVKLVLDVGLGTFRPMQTERIDEHEMHAESFAIPQATAGAIARAKHEGRRVVAAGTTVVRALEGSAAGAGTVRAGEGRTNLFVTPGFRFQIVDALITNFHLPRSTLLVLVSAFAGHDNTRRAYREAVDREYRFFSFGDAMFVEAPGYGR